MPSWGRALGVGPGEDQEVVGQGGHADPHLLAVEDVDVPLPPGGGGQRGDVRTRSRFGQAEGGPALPARLGDQEPLLLLLRPPLEQTHAVQAHVDAHHHPQERVHPLQFLAGQSQADVVHPLPAVADGDADAQDAQFGHAFHGPDEGFVGAVVLLDVGGHFLLGEVPHHADNHFVFRGQGEIHAFPPV